MSDNNSSATIVCRPVINPATGELFDFSKFSSDAMLIGQAVRRKLPGASKDGGSPKCKPGFSQRSVLPRPYREDDKEWATLFAEGKAGPRLPNGSWWTTTP